MILVKVNKMNFIKNLFFKRKNDEEIVLHAYTNDSLVYENFPISKASQYMPSWWKNIPSTLYREGAVTETPSNELPTMRKCPGFVELFKNSFVYPLWADLQIDVKGSSSSMYDYRFGFEHEYSLTSHPEHDRGEFLPANKFIHIKTPSVWVFNTEENIDWMTFGATWHQEPIINKVFWFPGVDNYKHNHATTWQFAVENKEQTIFIEAGTPLIQMIPVTERPVKIQSHYDPDAFNYYNRATSSFKFTNGYYSKIKQKKNQNYKCPFPH